MAVSLLASEKYHLMASLTNDHVFDRMEGVETPFMTEFASCWGLLVGSLLIASPVILFKIKDRTAMEDDLKFSDETAEDVMGVPLEDQQPSEKKDEKHATVA